MNAAGPIHLGRRIVVWGVTGSGKTTFARQLAAVYGLPRIEIDALYWHKGWVGTPDDELRLKLQASLEAAPAGWVLDGSYHRISDIYLPPADTLIWLHLPWRVSFWRLVKRTIAGAWTREPRYFEDGPRESWRLTFLSRDSILWWSIHHHRAGVRNARSRIVALPASVCVNELRSSREVAAFLDHLPEAPSRGSPASEFPSPRKERG